MVNVDSAIHQHESMIARMSDSNESILESDQRTLAGFLHPRHAWSDYWVEAEAGGAENSSLTRVSI
jgi:hypothetical protein